MTTQRETVMAQASRVFPYPAERVFDAWLDPEKARRFLFATPTGEMVTVEIDARVGGSFYVVERRDGEDAEHYGEYLEIDRPRRLVFSFAVPNYPSTKVIVEIAPRGTGCELTLTHEGVLPEFASRTEAGWSMILEGLAKAL